MRYCCWSPLCDDDGDTDINDDDQLFFTLRSPCTIIPWIITYYISVWLWEKLAIPKVAVLNELWLITVYSCMCLLLWNDCTFDWACRFLCLHCNKALLLYATLRTPNVDGMHQEKWYTWNNFSLQEAQCGVLTAFFSLGFTTQWTSLFDACSGVDLSAALWRKHSISHWNWQRLISWSWTYVTVMCVLATAILKAQFVRLE